MQSLSINTSKIDKTALYEGKSGKYLNLTLMENRDGPDQYGQDGFIIQDIGKERRERGEKGPIIGNWRYIGKKKDDGLGVRSPEYGKPETHQGRSTSQGGAPPPRDNGGKDYPDDDSDSIPFAPLHSFLF